MLESALMHLATLCYIKKDRQTLMLHRIKKKNDIHAGKWNGLGGKFLSGESPEECLLREVREESGLVLKSPLLVGFITFPKFAKEEDWYVFVYIGLEFTGDLIDSPEGELRWIEEKDLMKLELWEGDRLFLRWIEDRVFFSAKIDYENYRLIHHKVTFYQPVQW